MQSQQCLSHHPNENDPTDQLKIWPKGQGTSLPPSPCTAGRGDHPWKGGGVTSQSGVTSVGHGVTCQWGRDKLEGVICQWGVCDISVGGGG